MDQKEEWARAVMDHTAYTKEYRFFLYSRYKYRSINSAIRKAQASWEREKEPAVEIDYKMPDGATSQYKRYYRFYGSRCLGRGPNTLTRSLDALNREGML